MKMKMLIPRCFPLKLQGNNRSLQQSQSRSRSQSQSQSRGGKLKGGIKLINYDGTVKIYSRPIHVSEVLNEHPKYMVCPSDSFYIGQKIPSLSLHDKLQHGRSYLLLPKQFLHSVFSFTLFLQCQSGCAFLAKKAAHQPFDIQKTASGSLRIRISENFIAQLMEQGRSVKDDDDDDDDPISQICNTPQLQKDYQQLVGQRQYWKPKLDTISERHAHKNRISTNSVKTNKKHSNYSQTTTTTTTTTPPPPPPVVKQAGAGAGRSSSSSKHPNHHKKTPLAS